MFTAAEQAMGGRLFDALKVYGPTIGFGSEPENRSIEQYKAEVDRWAEGARAAVPRLLEKLATTVVPPVTVSVTHQARTFFEDVRLTVHLDGDVKAVSKRNHKLEVWWTIIPALVLVALGVFSANTWATIKYSKSPRYPKKFETEVRIRAQQFAWNVGYQGSDGKWDTNDDFEIKNVLNVPYEPIGPDGLVQREENVRILLTSQDVLHSFFVPAFRVKQDAVPGMSTNVWFTADKTGTYHLFCAEYCGTAHSTMGGDVVAMTPEDYAAWLNAQPAVDSPVAEGAALFRALGCSGCHTGGGAVRAPDLRDLIPTVKPAQD